MLLSLSNRRLATYFATAAFLILSYTVLQGSDWQGGATLHTVMEAMASVLAFVIGAMALVRYYVRKDSVFLFIGVGFLGTGFLDAIHGVVSSAYIVPLMPTEISALSPWSWFASRQFFAIFMAISWFAWFRESRLGAKMPYSERSVYIFASLFTIASFLFFTFVPLPQAYFPNAFFHRPEEFAPALFFLIALIGYLYKGQWRTGVFEHWLVLSLIIGFVSQVIFMSFSDGLFDMEFDVAHGLKKISYVCVLIGLMMSMFSAFQREEDTIRELDFQKRTLDEHAIVSITDVKGRITYCNDKFCDISGYSRERLIGQNHSLLKSDEHSKAFYQELWGTIAKGETWHGDIKNQKEDGSFYWVRATIVPFLNADGKPFQYAAIRTDITERKEYESALFDSREAALTAVNAKAQFLANMSHEIRTPMNGVIGMLELLKGTTLNSEQLHFADTATRSAEMQISVINDILDFSKIESNNLDLEILDFSLCDVIEDISALVGATSQAKNLVLTCFCDPKIPPTVVGDPTRMRQILANLAGNAVKFTDAGEINLSARLLSDSNGVATIRIEIQDTGIGINMDAQENLFQAFIQADISTTREYGGTGLGLSISNSLLELMNSNIELKSEIGNGSTFWFDIELPHGQVPEIAPSQSLHGLRVLAVDDNATNREILENYLNAWGMHPTMMDNSPETLAYIKENKGALDLLILDYHMPEIDGLELAQRITNDPAIIAPPMIMLSSGLPVDQKALTDAGIQARINKPFGRSKLLDAIMTTLGHKSAAPHISADSENLRIIGKVLLVEDSFINQQVAIGLLAKMGVSPDVANNGREGVEKAMAQDYDAILMDVQMPEMDGFQATSVLRDREKEENRHRTPIIAMTAHALKGDRERCLEAGMDDYIAKPVRFETLSEVLRNHLKTIPTPAKDPIKQASAHNPDEVELSIDVDAILDAGALKILRTSLNALPDAYRGVLKNFLSSVPLLCADITTAVTNNDPDQIERNAHILKSNCATLGAMELSNLATQAEAFGKAGEAQPVSELLSKMNTEYVRVKPAIEKLLDE